MTLQLLAVTFLAVLALGYWRWGSFVARQLDLDDHRATPANERNDGVDFVPTKPYYLFGQHFSAIAAAGPIAGPILACQLFGWGPSLLWIAFGVVLIGAVHDFTSLHASVRHGAVSLAEIARERIGPSAGTAMMAFIWIALVYIMVAFADITAASFVNGTEEIQGTRIDFNPGGAVAAASVLFLSIAIVAGFVQRFLNPPMWVMTAVFVPLAFASAYVGTQVSHSFIADARTWSALILIYCAAGSVMPVWSLLQPRGFLGGYFLYFALAVGVLGIFVGAPAIEQPLVKGDLLSSDLSSLFPFLFVTIACGACSGFHGLVCGGTTSKQIDREGDCKTVGYGAMLAEGFVAFIALSIVMAMTPEAVKGLKPGTIYGNGIGISLASLIGREHLPFAITLGAMAFSTFVFDTLDVSTRLGRYLIQELTGLRGRAGAALGTALTVGAPGLILLNTGEGSWAKFWTLFGASNQLLAALTFLTVTLWLYQRRKRVAFTLVPMLFVLVITLWALVGIAITSYQSVQGLDAAMLNAIASSALVVLAIFINVQGLRRYLLEKRLREGVPATGAVLTG